MRQTNPHRGPMGALPVGTDYTALYDQARPPPPLRRVPRWARRRDPLHRQPARQQLRATTIHAMWSGDASRVWADIQFNFGRAYFIPAFRAYLSFT